MHDNNLVFHTIRCDELTPIAIYTLFKHHFTNEISFLFESAVVKEEGNFSFIIIGAKERLTTKNHQTLWTDEQGFVHHVDNNPLNFLKKRFSSVDKEQYKELSKNHHVGFVDGFIGFIGYDMIRLFEPSLDDVMSNLEEFEDAPDFDMVRPRLIACFNHKKSLLTLISSDPLIHSQFDELTHLLTLPYSPSSLQKAFPLDEGQLRFNKERFCELVEESKENIRAGDIFQILLSNRFIQRVNVDALSFYRVLRTKNPSPYMFLLEFENFSIVGSSPEVMVRLTQDEILLRPIAGTRKRGTTHKRDKELEYEMLHDPKECSEHLMLIDLGRNDVGRVAKAGTVKVDDMMRVERYSHVMHMVSDVTAEIDTHYDMFDLLSATFTAGTMTGAPKIKAMELIAHYEKAKRGFYSGTIGYFGFDGNMDSAITIRSAFIGHDFIIAQAGGGVVADSIPELEFLEVTNKMAAIRTTLQELINL